MFSRYAYLQGATPANILADVCAILCGTTDKATLSAACNQTNTEISFSLNPATWVMHDNAATATGKVLKQACTDGISMKYIHLASSGNGNFTHGISETWNATTHTGTNNGSGSTSFDTTIDNTYPMATNASYSPSTTAGFINIYSDPYITTMSFRSNSSAVCAVLALEFTRSGPLMLPAYGYPNWCSSCQVLVLKRVRAKNCLGNGDVKGDSDDYGIRCAPAMFSAASNASFVFRYPYRNKDETTAYNILRLRDMNFFSVTGNESYGGRDYLGNCLSEIKFVSLDLFGTGFDEVIIEDATYVKDFSVCPGLNSSQAYSLYPKG